MVEVAEPGIDPIVACFSRPAGSPAVVALPDPTHCGLVSSLLEGEPYPVVVLDCAFDVTGANSRARELLGIGAAPLPVAGSTFVGGEVIAHLDDVFSGKDNTQTAMFRARVGGMCRHRTMHLKACRLLDPAGRTVGMSVSFSGALSDGGATSTSYSPERVEALGLYAAGIIHEFGNLLSVISGRAELGLMAQGPRAKDHAFENVITAARRAEHMTRNLLAYVQSQKPCFLMVDLRRPVLDAIGLLEVEFTSCHIEVLRKFDELPAVLCDPVQITQVCFNLLRNAKDAMPEGGAITATLKKEGSWAALSVADTGGGIPPEMHPRLFDPFVSHGRSSSLKPSGRGLGLFIAREIILAHGGQISVDSQVAKGSTFKFRLPLARPTADE